MQKVKFNEKVNRLKNETRDKAINMAVVPVNVHEEHVLSTSDSPLTCQPPTHNSIAVPAARATEMVG